MLEAFESLPDPLSYGFAIVTFGGWILIFWVVRMLFAGKLGTERELHEKEARIELLEKALHTRDEQVTAALAVLPEIADVLKKFHAAAAEKSKADQL